MTDHLPHTTERLRALGEIHARDLEDARRSRNQLKVAVRIATDAGLSEVRAAELARVSRPTIRAWRGKDKRVDP
jgi:uncharacterized membrane-anchored protein